MLGGKHGSVYYMFSFFVQTCMAHLSVVNLSSFTPQKKLVILYNLIYTYYIYKQTDAILFQFGDHRFSFTCIYRSSRRGEKKHHLAGLLPCIVVGLLGFGGIHARAAATIPPGNNTAERMIKKRR